MIDRLAAMFALVHTLWRDHILTAVTVIVVVHLFITSPLDAQPYHNYDYSQTSPMQATPAPLQQQQPVQYAYAGDALKGGKGGYDAPAAGYATGGSAPPTQPREPVGYAPQPQPQPQYAAVSY